MRIGFTRASSLSACALLATTAALATGGIAFAANASKGATYEGAYVGRPTFTISFKVSANGKKVIDLDAETPFKCGGGCGGVGSAENGSARIKRNKFKVTIKIYGPGEPKSVEGTDTISGTFGKHGTAEGKVTSHFNKSSSGETVSWTADS